MARPNVVLMLVDDMGFSDIGCYGGEISTPNLDRLATNGVRLSQFYNTARCSPSRASLLTGLHPHQTGIGILTNDTRPRGYAGTINNRCVTIAEVLKSVGYATCLSGKWHLAAEIVKPNDAWPTRRGFDRFFGTLTGCGSFFQPGTLMRGEVNVEDEALQPDFFYTDAISDEAEAFIRDRDSRASGQPFFLYVAYTAPHWPLHARERGHRQVPWQVRRGLGRAARAKACAPAGCGTPRRLGRANERDPTQPAWNDANYKDWQAKRMEAYAAQIDRVDQGVGRILEALEANRRARQHDDHLPLRQRRIGRGVAARRARALQGAIGYPAPQDPRRPQRADRQRAFDRSRCRGHVRKLRSCVGQPLEHAVPLLQAVDARRRHRDAVHRALATGSFAQRQRRARTVPTGRRAAQQFSK